MNIEHAIYIILILDNVFIKLMIILQTFFGIIRQVVGPNDHPSCPSFLQLYRRLSVFSLIKPLKSGNCMIFECKLYYIENQNKN